MSGSTDKFVSFIWALNYSNSLCFYYIIIFLFNISSSNQNISSVLGSKQGEVSALICSFNMELSSSTW